MTTSPAYTQLMLQQLADSAFPIGGQAHSFGVEMLTSEGLLTPAGLEAFLTEYLTEVGVIEGWGSCSAYRLAGLTDDTHFVEEWLRLNQRLSALRTARESRSASAALGRRFLTLVQTFAVHPRLTLANQVSRADGGDLHHAATFGLTSGLLGLGEEAATLAFLHQSINSILAATQKLLPIGQSQTVGILWRIKPGLLAAVERSRAWHWEETTLRSFSFMLDLASMRHATLPVRLFIS